MDEETASPSIVAHDWPYRDGDTALTGVLVRDQSAVAPQPGILLVHGGGGLDDHARGQACRYASLGYVVFACDMLGDGARGDRDRIISCLTSLRDDPALMLGRAQAGLAALSGAPGVDHRRAAVGFCFGGLVALTLARSAVPLAAAVSMHGTLASISANADSTESGPITAKVLACHGARDPYVPPADVSAFAEEMIQADADWQLIMYGRAVHGFTHADAVQGAIPGVAYDPVADRESFAAAGRFLAQAFAGSAGEPS